MKLETKAYISDYDGECYDIELDENIFTKEEKENIKKEIDNIQKIIEVKDKYVKNKR